MTDCVIIVTPPDDLPLKDGIRILCIDLTTSQSQIVSDTFNLLNNSPTLITYVWNNSNNTEWVIDKKQKSQVIIFNAESQNQLLVGYMAAQANSYYFGVLKTLQVVNNNAIYDKQQLFNILERVIDNYEKK